MNILSNMRIVIIALSLVLTGIRGEVLQAVLGDWSQDPDSKYGISNLMRGRGGMEEETNHKMSVYFIQYK
jgi:hypothetical protein